MSRRATVFLFFLLTIVLLASLPLIAHAKPPSRGIAWPWFEKTAAKEFYRKGKTEWVYNWETYYPTGGSHSPMEFVPMQRTSEGISSLSQAASVQSAKWILGFNEPDMPLSVGGSDLTPAEAARLWKKYLAPLRSSSSSRTRLLVAPAVSVSTSQGQGSSWLNMFRANCTGCIFDAYAIHPYASTAEGVQEIIDTWLNQYQIRPLWITEFGLDSSSSNNNARGKEFIQSMIRYFNGKDQGEIMRYSMIARQAPNKSVTGKDLQFVNGTLRVMGKMYRDYATTLTR